MPRLARRLFSGVLLSSTLTSLLTGSGLAMTPKVGEGDEPPARTAATFSVDTTDDDSAASLCTAAPGDCSLRGAIIAANANPGPDTVILAATTYTLTVEGAFEDAALTGDLDILDDLTLLVSGEQATINGGGLDQVFEVFSTTVDINVSLSDVVIRNGGSAGSGGGIGGIYNHDRSALTLTNVAILSNTGIGLYNVGANAALTVHNSTISGNTASGIQNDGGAVNINNSTLSGNSALNGGAIHANGGLVSLNNATITNNSATNGGGIRRVSGTVLMKNTILAGNSASNGPNCYPASPNWLTSTGNNLLGSMSGCGFASAGGDQTGVSDPKLGPLLDNGGPTLTHALLSNSPALNAGNVSGCTNHSGDALSEDQRGTDRPQGGRCDIGAYEVPAVKLDNGGVFSVNEGSGSAAITARLDGASAYPVTVNYATANGTAIAGSDYATTSGALTFAPFDVSETFTVPVTNDSLFEASETVNLTLGNPVSATMSSPTTGVLTIVDNDLPPEVHFSLGSYSVAESAGTALITVTLSAASGQTATVSYATANVTALAGSDFTTANGVLTFPPPATSKTIGIPITNDNTDEPNETFHLTLSAPLGATITGANPVAVTILDDDLPSVYLPLTLRNYSTFFTGFEVEPNNSSSAANGPLGAGLSVSGAHNDLRDYFFFNSGGTGTVAVSLSTALTQGVQLQLYYQSTSTLVDYDPTPPYNITKPNRPAGKYLIIIYTASQNPSVNYTLTATFP
jgi:hypothetical protein